MNKLPETHLVKLRTDENYSVINKKGLIKSQKNLRVILVNIRPGNLIDGFLYKQDHDIYSYVYTTDLKIKSK